MNQPVYITHISKRIQSETLLLKAAYFVLLFGVIYGTRPSSTFTCP